MGVFSKYWIWVIVIISAIFHSCQGRLSVDKMPNYISDPDNGLVFTHLNGNVKITLTYQPAEWLAWKEASLVKVNRDSVFNALKVFYGNQDYFLLGLSVNGKELTHSVVDMATYADVRSKLSFRFNECLSATSGQDTLALLDSQVNNTYGAAPETQVLFAIERSTSKEKVLKIYLANLFPNMRPVTAYFDRQKLNDIPNLDID